MKAIIIDDEIWSRRMIRSLGQWESLGIEIMGEAENGVEGWELIQKLRPDLILMDMRMPGMEGTELLRKLNEYELESKVIVISGHEDFNYTKHAIDYRAFTYILKPIDEDELNVALRNCIQEIKASALMRKQEMDSFHYHNRELMDAMRSPKKKLLQLLEGLNREGMRQEFERIYRELASRDPVSPAGYRRIYMEFYMQLEDYLGRSNEHIQELLTFRTYTDLPELDEEDKETIAIVNRLAWLYDTAAEYIIYKRKSKEKLCLTAVKAYMDQNFEQYISLEYIANKFFVSKEYLSKAFKTEYNINLTDYFIKLRMERARTLLQDSDMKVKEIAQLVGYEDVSYFNRLFKNYYGESPKQMRESSTLI